MSASFLPSYAQVKNSLRKRILSGKYTDRLPTEHALALEFEVSYMTMRRAVGELVDDGILVRKVGKGTFIAMHGTEQKNQSVGNIAFVIPPWVSEGILNQFIGSVLRGMEESAANASCSISILNANINFWDIKSWKKKNCDALISPVYEHNKNLRELGKHMPVVCFGDWSSPAGLHRVFSDSSKGARMALEYLYKLGHRKIGIMPHDVQVERDVCMFHSYKEFLAESGIEFNRKFVFPVQESFRSALEVSSSVIELKESMPTAILCHNDVIAAALMKRLLSAGIRVPEDISIFGNDGLPAGEMTHPGLSTIDSSAQEIGKISFNLVKSMLDGLSADTELEHELPRKLIIRESTSAPARR